MIEFENISKFYGQHQALFDLSFKLSGNQVVGLLGPNGAGKTTTMKILSGAMAASTGSYRFGDTVLDLTHEHAWKQKLGYLPEKPPVYEELSVIENLEFWGGLKSLTGLSLKNEIDRVIDRCGLIEVKNRLGHVLSKGYRQRLGIAKALLGDPDFLILDEPISGLDPQQMIEVRSLVKELGNDHLVVFSSHQLYEVEQICSRFLFLNKGKLLASATKKDLQGLLGNEVLKVHLFNSIDQLPQEWAGARKSTDLSWELATDKSPESALKLMAALEKNKIAVERFYWEESDLETMFLNLLGEKNNEL